jgi:hypothetical protein
VNLLQSLTSVGRGVYHLLGAVGEGDSLLRLCVMVATGSTVLLCRSCSSRNLLVTQQVCTKCQ